MRAPSSPSVGIIGAGPMGLALAYHLLQRGAAVEVFEADDRVGGMSASFDFDGLPVERYYHFICGPDDPMFRLLDELGVKDALRWRDTKMGFFYRGTLHRWGNPLALLTFPHLDIVSKLRYAAHVMWTKSVTDWGRLDRVEASEWIERWIGRNAYDVLWRFLFEKKFYELTRPLSAAWIGTRIKRVALSRRDLFHESMGYLDGGSQTMLDRLTAEIARLGGTIRLNAPVERVAVASGRAAGLVVAGEERPFDAVFSTVPLPYLPRLVPDLPAGYRARVEAVKNIGVVCVSLKLKAPFTENFWTNVNDPAIAIPGLIEISNLRPMAAGVLYAPWYMPRTNPLWARSDEEFITETIAALQRIRPDFRTESILGARAFRYEYAQPICPPGFRDVLPPYATGVEGLFAADTTHSYPEDRSINESVRVARELADLFLPAPSPTGSGSGGAPDQAPGGRP